MFQSSQNFNVKSYIDIKYSGKDIYIAFCDEGTLYIYPRDEVLTYG